MKYKLHALSIFEVGQRKDKEGRPHQEDCIYPSIDNVGDNDRLFILCDGMGGHASGEVASQNVCQTISELVMNPSDSVFTDALFERALAAAYDKLDNLDKDKSEHKKMGTTLTFLMFHQDGATIAHIGDSRVYQIRPKTGTSKDVVFKTRDHSLVNDLIKVGELRPEDAKKFPHKNIITRAIQPHLEERHKADIYHTKNIQPGDYFFMCSDGMLEQMDDDNPLCFILNENRPDEEKQEMLCKVTQSNKDNHSAHLIHILDVEPKSEIEEVSPVEERTKEDELFVTPETSNFKKCFILPQIKKQRSYYILLTICTLLVLSTIIYTNDSVKNIIRVFPSPREVITPKKDSLKPTVTEGIKNDTIHKDTMHEVKPNDIHNAKNNSNKDEINFDADDLNEAYKKDEQATVKSDADKVTNILEIKK